MLVFCALMRVAAADFSFSGTFTKDDDQRSFFFTLANPGSVTLATTSYASGSFDPSLAVFDSNGNLIANNRDGGCANVAANPVTGYCWDAYLALTLPAGTYQAVLTQSDNVAKGPTLSNAFAYTGQGNFTIGPESTGTGGFWSSTGVQVRSSFGVGLRAVDTALAQIVISQQSPPSGKVGVAYSSQLGVSGGTQPYTWTVSSGSLPPGLTLSSGGLLAGTPTLAGTYNFTVQSADSSTPQMMASQPFQILVIPQDLQITTSSLSTWVVNNAFSATLVAIGGYPPYSWTLQAGAVANGLALGTSGTLSGTPSATGLFSIPVQVTDSQQNTIQANLSWQVNAAIQITSTATLPAGITGQPYPGFTFAATGGATVSDVWTVTAGTAPPGLTLSSAGALQGTTGTKGNYTFTVQASDGIQPAHQNVALNVYDPLSITTLTLPGSTIGTPYPAFNLSASGGSGSYAWSSANLPQGLALSSAGQISGSPVSGGAYNVTVNLTDSAAGQSASAKLSISIGYQNLTISGSGALGGVAVGSAVSKSFSAQGGRSPYTWSATGLPPGLSIDPASGTLSGTATQTGNFTFTVQVTDAEPLSATVSGSLAVLGFTTTSLPAANTVAAYSQTLAASGGTPPYSFSGSGIPGGLSLSGSGVLSGIPKSAGTYSFTVQLTDAAGISISSTFSLTVTAPSTITVSGASLSQGTAGKPYSDTLAANGGAPPYAWTIVGGALPDGLSAASSGTVSGTPTKPGTFSFTAQATDSSGGKASGASSITIAAPALSAPTTSSLPNGIVGVYYSSQIQTPSGGVPPYTLAVSTGSLPAGLSLQNGQILGTPTATGTSSFTVQASDSATPPSTASTALAVLINPSQADLLLSSSAVNFSLASGATGVPTPSSVPVRSSTVQEVLSYSVQANPPASWLDVSGGGSTPGSVSLSVDASAVNLTPSTTPYQTTISVMCTAPSPCAGHTQTISVSLTVSAPPPQLTITNSLLSFGLTSPTAQVASQSFGIQNSGGGSVGIKSATAADSWITITGVPGAVSAGPATSVTATVNTAGLVPGFYRTTITVTSSAGSASLPVALLYAQTSSMSLNPSGTQFVNQQGGAPGNPAGTFSVAVASGGTVNWTAVVQPGAPWLTLNTPNGTSNAASPGQVSFSINSTAATLAPQAYYGTIRVSSGDVFNSPLDFEVVLNVAPTTDPAKPDPEPAGLVFISSSAGALPPQTVQVFTSSTAPSGFQASAATTDGAGWLSVTPAVGNTSSTAAASTAVSADPTGLKPGVYTGGISYAFAGAAVRTVNVTLIVEATSPATHVVPALTSAAAPASSCTPTKLVPTQTGLVNNFAQPAAWPTPLSILLVDDCGAPILNGQVAATFSNGDPPLSLAVNDAKSGIYGGTWTPRNASAQITISAKATATGYSPATAQITGQVNPNKAPVLTPGATLHVFDPLVGGSLGPGNIVQIYGSYLSAQTMLAQTIPLPTNVGGTSVIIGGMPAPIYFVSAGQINAQVPFELIPGKKYQILINANGALTTPDSIQLTDVSPGIAAFASGQIIAQHLDGSLITEASPAMPSEIIVFYMAGLGQTDNPVASGAASPSAVLARPLTMPLLTLNGENVPILFGGLTPGLVGLYQVNFQVPADAADGDLALVVSQSGTASNQTVLPVHH